MKIQLKRFVYAISCVLICTNFLISCETKENMKEQKQALSTLEKEPIKFIGEENKYNVITENNNLKMLLDTSTMEILIKQKSDGYTYSTFGSISEGVLDDKTKNEILSHLIITYYDSGNKEYTFNSYSNSVLKGQYKIFSIKNGIRIEYTLGEAVGVVLFPEAISRDMMENKILKNLSEEDREYLKLYYTLYESQKINEQTKKDISNKYKNFTKSDLYIVAGVGKRIKDQIVEILTKAGVTNDDIEKDYKKIGYNKVLDKSPSFSIPIEFTLNNSGFSANVKYSEIKYDREAYKINTIEPLKFFASAPKNSNGYIFIPDGCGALINTDNNSSQIFESKVYDLDINTVSLKEYSQKQAPVFFPVFGIKNNEHAFLAVIEEGSALASIFASTYNNPSKLNFSGASFKPLPRGEYDATGIAKNSVVIKYGKEEYNQDIKIKYFILTGNDANYVGMAKSYQSYIFNNENKLINQNYSLFIDTYGVMNVSERFFGLELNTKKPFTSLQEINKILVRLRNKITSNIILRYNNWTNDEIFITKFNLKMDEKIGSLNDIKEFNNFINNNRIEFYPNFDPVYFEGDAANNLITKTGQMLPLTKNLNPIDINKEDEKALKVSLFSPKSVSDNISSLNQSKDKNLSISSIGRLLYTDFNEKNFSNREKSLDMVSKSIKKLSEEKRLLFDGVNAYILPYAKKIVNIPIYNSSYEFENEQVPFLQIVLHGYVEYATEPFNDLVDTEFTMLKSIEYGQSIRYILNYKDVDFLKNTSYINLFSTNYTYKIEEMSEIFNKMQKALEGLTNKTIVWHEKIAENVYLTKYENGSKIYVNYNDSEYNSIFGTIGAKSFLRID